MFRTLTKRISPRYLRGRMQYLERSRGLHSLQALVRTFSEKARYCDVGQAVLNGAPAAPSATETLDTCKCTLESKCLFVHQTGGGTGVAEDRRAEEHFGGVVVRRRADAGGTWLAVCRHPYRALVTL